MKEIVNLPSRIPVFPLSNFIIFPDTMVPLNIFEPRYIQMVDDAMKGERIIGMVQPKNSSQSIPALYDIGCAGKIKSFNETEDGRYLIVLVGIARFKITKELANKKLYRECEVNFGEFSNDINFEKEDIKFSDLELIFKNLKSLFDKQGYLINWKELEKQNINQTINTLAMASPFSLEEKQILLETTDIKNRKVEFERILQTYVVDNFSNKTLQ